ncbi:hypothetical protein OUZ56_011582 [Daphnia magna]|uniref:Uncharacterized protein n=1 Tax=Daphnia magna TaxID=35525 RepID=A0ABQ9Z0S7_9CRUS|nr:hypothetical protein OUZ56_011582 [Daphnia magna]
MFRTYTTAAYASSEASQKICISEEIRASPSGNKHLGVSTLRNNRSAWNHSCHQHLSSPTTASVHFKPLVPSSLSRILALTISGEAVPRGSNTVATRLTTSTRVKLLVQWLATLNPRVSEEWAEARLMGLSSDPFIKRTNSGELEIHLCNFRSAASKRSRTTVASPTAFMTEGAE